MKNTRKKNTNTKNNKTKKNTKEMVNKCMDTFVDKNVKYWTEDYTKEIRKLENKKTLTKEDHKLLSKFKKQKINQTKSLKKQYKLFNCNINCKNTILEPGPPNQIPKSMQKEYHNNKQLIQIFNNQRKSIFKNKTNVLIDNFYEKTPEKTKNKLIKEGAISSCVPTNDN